MDLLVACFKSGGVLLLSSGIFPILSLRVQDIFPPALLPSLPPMTPSPGGGGGGGAAASPTVGMMISTPPTNNAMATPAKPHPGLSPATPGSGGTGSGKKRPLARVTAVTAPADLGALLLAVDGAGGQASFLLSLPMPALWRNRHQLKSVTAEFAALGALVEHVQEALDQGERLWRDRCVAG